MSWNLGISWNPLGHTGPFTGLLYLHPLLLLKMTCSPTKISKLFFWPSHWSTFKPPSVGSLDGGRLLRNVDNHQRHHMVSHPTRRQFLCVQAASLIFLRALQASFLAILLVLKLKVLRWTSGHIQPPKNGCHRKMWRHCVIFATEKGSACTVCFMRLQTPSCSGKYFEAASDVKCSTPIF